MPTLTPKDAKRRQKLGQLTKEQAEYYAPKKIKTFSLVAIYTAECCNEPHVWTETIAAPSREKAKNAFETRLHRKHFTPEIILAVPQGEVYILKGGLGE